MKNSTRKGFTLVEVLVVAAFATLLLIFGFTQFATMNAIDRDEQSKTAINAMYYSLEEAFYAENGYYPQEINETILTTMDPELFTDPNGINLGTEGSTYAYEPANCDTDGRCQEYTLRADLEREEDYIKRSRNN